MITDLFKIDLLLINGKLHFFAENFGFFEKKSDFLKKNLSETFWKSQSQLRDFGARLRIAFYASENYFLAWLV
jgi:hypothetical protein